MNPFFGQDRELIPLLALLLLTAFLLLGEGTLRMPEGQGARLSLPGQVRLGR